VIDAPPTPTSAAVIDLGRCRYEDALGIQREHLDRVLAARASAEPEIGRILLVEHDPVITVTRRAGVDGHIVATPEMLEAAGVRVLETDRGGDITYHGPGQLVVYPILDLNRIGLRLHDHMRMLEQAVIDCIAEFGIAAEREKGATGVWIRNDDGSTSKICAMGVRIRRWVSMHGLALNVTTNLAHFDLIVPCGLQGRRVTSVSEILGHTCPTLDQVKESLVGALQAQIARTPGLCETKHR